MGTETKEKVILAEIKAAINLQDTELIENFPLKKMITEGGDQMITEVTEDDMVTEKGGVMNPSEKYKLYRNIFISIFICSILLIGADVKWSDWTSVTTLESTDLIPMVENDSGDNRTITAANFFNWESGKWTLNQDSDGDNFAITLDNAGGTPQDLFLADPDLPGLQFLNESAVPRITFFESSSAPFIDMYSGTTTAFIRTRTAGIDLYFQMIDTGAANRTLAVCVPDRRSFEIGDFITYQYDSELTISGGVITANATYHTVDTESDAASDDLDTINGFAVGKKLILRCQDSTRTVVIKDSTGNIETAGDFSLDNIEDTITLIGTASGWYEISRSNNGA
jgi:hypothetical protein